MKRKQTTAPDLHSEFVFSLKEPALKKRKISRGNSVQIKKKDGKKKRNRPGQLKRMQLRAQQGGKLPARKVELLKKRTLQKRETKRNHLLPLQKREPKPNLPHLQKRKPKRPLQETESRAPSLKRTDQLGENHPSWVAIRSVRDNQRKSSFCGHRILFSSPINSQECI